MKHLSEKKCEPCKGGIPKLTGDEAKIYLTGISNWSLIEDHHPEMILSWGKVFVSIWTHKIDGLHENDFILAAKIDEL